MFIMKGGVALRKYMFIVAGLLILTLVCSACSVPISAPIASSFPDEKLLSDVRADYRNASLIVSGVCTGSQTYANGELCYYIDVEVVYAGDASVGDRVECGSYVMQTGERYLLFLKTGEDVDYAEDTLGYSLLSEAPLPILDEAVLMDGKRLALDAFAAEISQYLRLRGRHEIQVERQKNGITAAIEAGQVV